MTELRKASIGRHGIYPQKHVTDIKFMTLPSTLAKTIARGWDSMVSHTSPDAMICCLVASIFSAPLRIPGLLLHQHSCSGTNSKRHDTTKCAL